MEGSCYRDKSNSFPLEARGRDPPRRPAGQGAPGSRSDYPIGIGKAVSPARGENIPSPSLAVESTVKQKGENDRMSGRCVRINDPSRYGRTRYCYPWSEVSYNATPLFQSPPLVFRQICVKQTTVKLPIHRPEMGARKFTKMMVFGEDNRPIRFPNHRWAIRPSLR